MRHPLRPGRRRPARALVALCAVGVVLGGAVPASAQDAPPAAACAGVAVTVAVDAPTLPAGTRAATDVCVPPEAVYETTVLGYQLVGALGAATFDDGTTGRVALLQVRVTPEAALSLVGVEDAATGEVTWAYAEAGLTEADDVRSTSGPAETVTLSPEVTEAPVQPGALDLALRGRGTDLATAQGPVPDQIRTFLDEAVAALSAG